MGTIPNIFSSFILISLIIRLRIKFALVGQNFQSNLMKKIELKKVQSFSLKEI